MGMVLEGRSGIPIEGNEQGQLLTHATSVAEEHEANRAGNGYILPLSGIAADPSKHICVIKNTDVRDLIITALTMYVAEYKDNSRVQILLNESLAYAAGGTAVVPTNVRSGRTGGAEGKFYTLAASGTDITTFTGTSTIAGNYIFERYPIKFSTDSGWVIPKNQVFSVYLGAGGGNTFYGHVSFYYHA